MTHRHYLGSTLMGPSSPTRLSKLLVLVTHLLVHNSTHGMLVVSVKTARQEGAHQEEFIPGALGLALAKGDEGSFEVLGHVLHALVERATSCLSCPAQLRRGIEKQKLSGLGNLGESAPHTADAGDPAAPGRHDGGTVDVEGRKPSEPGRDTHDPGEQLQPVPVSTQTEAFPTRGRHRRPPALSLSLSNTNRTKVEM